MIKLTGTINDSRFIALLILELTTPDNTVVGMKRNLFSDLFVLQLQSCLSRARSDYI